MRASMIAGILFLSVAAAGQDFPRAEIFGGYSYGKFDVLNNRSSLNGWNASATVNLYRWFGLTTDFGGLYGGSATETIVLPTLTEIIHVTERSHTFLFGPQVTYRHGHLAPFAHMLLGEARLSETRTITCTGTSCFTATGSVTQTISAGTAAVAAGGGVDYVFTPRLAWRVQADYLQLGAANDARISTGIVFRLGK